MNDCRNGTPPGEPTVGELELVDTPTGVRLDSDGDGCPDKSELHDDETEGGLRDPYNRWDYFEPTHNGQVRIDDVLAVINNYRADDPPNTNWVDRTAIEQANDWNLGPPDGTIRTTDILAVNYQYHHDCVDYQGIWPPEPWGPPWE